MKKKFEDLTRFIPAIKDDSFGKWAIDHENDESSEHPKQFPFVSYSDCVCELEEAIYNFVDNNPDMNLTNYGDILRNNQVQWDMESMKDADVSSFDGQAVMALLVGAIRAERFSDGAMLKFLKSGSVLRWLERLEEIDSK